MHTYNNLAKRINLTVIALCMLTIFFFSVAITRPAAAASNLILQNQVLLFTNPSDVTFTITGSSTSVTWNVKNSSDEILQEGTTEPDGTTNLVHLQPIVTGYYTLTFSAEGNDPITAAFGVTGPALSKNNYYSIQTLSAHTAGFWRNDMARITPMLKSIGFSARRDSAYWDEFEQTQGNYVTTPVVQGILDIDQQNDMSLFWTAGRGNSLYDNGLVVSTPEGILAYAKYIDAFLTQHPEIKQVELLNEFNGNSNSACGATATCYVAIAQGVYEYVKPLHPDVEIVAGGTSSYSQSWWNEYFAAGGNAYADAFSYHPYNLATYRLNEVATALTNQIKSHNNGVGKPIYMSEIGWSITDSTTGNAAKVSTEKQQADRIVYSFVAPQANPEIASVNWYNGIDYGSTPTEYGFGIFKRPTTNIRGYQPKQAAIAFYQMRKQLEGYTFSRTEMLAPTARAYVFTNQAGDTQKVVWRTDTFWSKDEATIPVTITTSGEKYSTVTDTAGRRVASFDTNAASFDQDVSLSPLFIVSSNTAPPVDEIPTTPSNEEPGLIPGVPNTGILGFLNRPQPLLIMGLGIVSAVTIFRLRKRNQ